MNRQTSECRKLKGYNAKGFTLVELIVVLVLLTMLAAIVVPVVFSYIDQARIKEDMIAAESAMAAIQSELSVEYGFVEPEYASGLGSAKDVLMTVGTNETRYKHFVENVFEMADIPEDPFLLLFYTMKVDIKNNENFYELDIDKQHEAYSCLSVVYWRDKGSTPVYYDFVNNQWGIGSPYSDDHILRTKNIIQDGVLKDREVRVCVVSSTSKYLTQNNPVAKFNDMIFNAVDYNGKVNTRDKSVVIQ